MGTDATIATVAGLTAAVGTLTLTPLAIRVGHTLGLVDRPHARKVHRVPTPRIGGVAIGAATLAAVAVAAVFVPAGTIPEADAAPLLTLLAGALALGVVGLIDDAWEVSSRYKLVALIAAAAALCASGGRIRSLNVHGLPGWHLGLAAWPVTFAWVVGVTVSVNFIDGLDGLAAGIVAIAAAVLAVGTGVAGYTPGVAVAVALSAALAGFLVYNRHPAKTFMGDSGSMFIGYLLAGACVVCQQRCGTVRGLALPGVALSVPLLDTFFTFIRRGVLQRRSLFAAERGHVHHRLLDIGLAHPHVVHLLHLVTLAGAGVALIGVFGNKWASLIAAAAFYFGLVGLFRTAGSVRARETLDAVRRNRAIGRRNRRYQNAFYDLQTRFREAHTVDAWTKLVCHAADMLGFAKLNLPLVRRDGTTTLLRWRREAGEGETVAAHGSITAEVPIPQRRNTHQLRAEVEVLADDSLESAGNRLALFSRLMSEYGLDQVRGDAGRPVTPEATPAAARPAAVATAVVDAPAAPTPAHPAGAFPGLRVAIVHDFLYTYAGAERVLEQLIAVFPQCELFSLFDFVPADQRGFLQGRPVTPSFLQRMPFARTRHRAYLPLMPLAIEQLDVSNYDLVLTSSYVAAKGVITRPDQLHVCYCHTPVRFAWDLQHQYLGRVNLTSGLKSTLVRMVLHYIRNWDVRSASGVDLFLTNSDFVGRRIRKLYRRESTTIYPPVDTDAFALHEVKEDFYLTTSRMVPYKRIDLIVAAFARLPDRRLIVAGTGPEMDAIKAKAGPNVTLLGHVPAENLRRLMQLARAFVFAAEEDFGIAPVEAQACGTPVIAFGRGGAAETVRAGVTGVFFHEQTPAAIAAAVRRFEERADWDPKAIRANAERFSAAMFRERVTAFVRDAWAAFEDDRLNRLTAPTADDPTVSEVVAGDVP